jgi:hypothetical protein
MSNLPVEYVNCGWLYLLKNGRRKIYPTNSGRRLNPEVYGALVRYAKKRLKNYPTRPKQKKDKQNQLQSQK